MIWFVLGASVAGGLLSGVITGMTGLPFPVALAVIYPSTAVLVWQLMASRRRDDGEPQATPGVAVTLLDARVVWRRLVQTVLPPAGTLLAAAGIAQAIRADSSWGAWAGVAAIGGVVMVVASLLYAISWEVSYREHRILFRNHPCLAERLYIDGVLVDRGGLGVTMTLRGAIQSGDGAGDRITATSIAGLWSFSCRIVAEELRRSG
jgi:hypothetical protein